MKKLLVFVAAVLILASCSIKIQTDKASDIDLSGYETIKIEYQPNKGSQQISAINAQRVENAIQKQTQARGLYEDEDADLRIVWGVGMDIQRNYTTYSTYHHHGGYGYRGRYGGYGSGSGHSDMREYTTTNGTFQIALIDSKTEEFLWITTVSGEIKGKVKKADQKIDKLMEKVFDEFPVEKYS